MILAWYGPGVGSGAVIGARVVVVVATTHSGEHMGMQTGTHWRKNTLLPILKQFRGSLVVLNGITPLPGTSAAGEW